MLHSTPCSMISQPSCRLYTAEMRPDLWDALKDENHPLNKAWPYFLDQDLSHQHFGEKLIQYKGLRKFQFALVECDQFGTETIIACARSIPFFWPELEGVGDTESLSEYVHVLQSLPDGGWDTIFSRALRQYCFRKGVSKAPPAFTTDQEQDSARYTTAMTPNALSALSITVRHDRRMLGLAEKLLEAMKQVARDENLRVLVVPLRPTRKSEFPFVPMEDYVAWTQAPSSLSNDLSTPPLSNGLTHSQLCQQDACTSSRELPYDPWLRKHIRLGAKLAKIAPSSMIVQGTFSQWQSWTGIDFHKISQDVEGLDLKTGSEHQGRYQEVTIREGLVPLRVYVWKEMCIYAEPNVWLYHEL